MAQAATYADLLPDMVAYLALCEDPVKLQALRRAGRRFCDDTESWREEVEPLPVVDYQRDYTIPNIHSANIKKIRWVKVNGIIQPSTRYRLQNDAVLRWEMAYEPANMTAAMVKCGTAGTAVVATWNAITDGSVVIPFNNTQYALTGLNFSAAATMSDVAQIIETALRLASTSTYVRVGWYSSNHFVVFSESGLIDFLAAGTAGTDISGAGYMNGLNGGTGVKLAAYILCGVSFKPWMAADELPAWFLERYAEGLVAYAMTDLLTMPKQPWTNPDGAALFAAQGRSWRARARTFNIDAGADDHLTMESLG